MRVAQIYLRVASQGTLSFIALILEGRYTLFERSIHFELCHIYCQKGGIFHGIFGAARSILYSIFIM